MPGVVTWSETCKEYSSCATNWRYAHWSTVSLLISSLNTMNFMLQCQGECCETNYQRRTVDCIALVANELISCTRQVLYGRYQHHTLLGYAIELTVQGGW